MGRVSASASTASAVGLDVSAIATPAASTASAVGAPWRSLNTAWRTAGSCDAAEDAIGSVIALCSRDARTSGANRHCQNCGGGNRKGAPEDLAPTPAGTG